MLLRCESLEPPMSQLGHSRRDRAGQTSSNFRSFAESGRKFSGPAAVAMCHKRL
jgi:hypothetical protein